MSRISRVIIFCGLLCGGMVACTTPVEPGVYIGDGRFGVVEDGNKISIFIYEARGANDVVNIPSGAELPFQVDSQECGWVEGDGTAGDHTNIMGIEHIGELVWGTQIKNIPGVAEFDGYKELVAVKTAEQFAEWADRFAGTFGYSGGELIRTYATATVIPVDKSVEGPCE